MPAELLRGLVPSGCRRGGQYENENRDDATPGIGQAHVRNVAMGPAD